MRNWDEAAAWYLEMVGDRETGFNDLAADVALELFGRCQGRVVLDLGCGEGHVARRLARSGALVVGVDPTMAFVNAARAAERQQPLGIDFRLEGAEQLGSLDDGYFDAVVSVLALHHVADLDAALGEVQRVLKPGGRVIGVIPHPWADHPGASWASDGMGAKRVVGEYFAEGPLSEDDDQNGTIASMRQVGWYHRTVATWLTSLAQAGFYLDRVVEPTGAGSGRSDGGGQWSATPRFLGFAATAR